MLVAFCVPFAGADQAGSPAQEQKAPEAAFLGQTTTLVVEVPVEVTLQGEPVRGLTKDRFQLYDGRKEQEILSVDEVDLVSLDRQAAEDPQQLPVAARRHFLLLFDRTYARPAAITRAR